MQRRIPAVHLLVHDLVMSGMQRQLREGDSIGVWTFSDELRTGEFPLQQWSTNSAKTIAQRIAYFIQSRTNDGVGRLDKVLPALNKLVEDSEFLTIVLCTSGDHPFTGSPFDQQINETFRVWQAEQIRAQMPFTTVLRASGSKIISFAVTPAPWPVELPPLQSEMRERFAATTKKPATRPRPNTPPAAAKPLVFSGSDPTPAHAEPEDVAVRKPEPLQSPVPRAAAAEVPSEAQRQVRDEDTPQSQPAKEEIFGPPAPKAPVVNVATAAELLNAPAPSSTPAAKPSPLVIPQTSAVPVAAPAGAPTLTSVLAQSNAALTSAPKTVSSTNSRMITRVAAPKVAAPVQSTTRLQAEATPMSPRAPAPALQARPANAKVESEPGVLEVRARAHTPEELPDRASPAVVAAAPHAPPWMQRSVAITGAALALTALALLFMRKPRPARASLITRSLDRDFGR